MARVVGTFCTELDGSAAANNNKVDETEGASGNARIRRLRGDKTQLCGARPSAFLFVIGATNRPDLIDPNLLTSQRFGHRVYCGMSGRENRIDALRAGIERFEFEGSATRREGGGEMTKIEIAREVYVRICEAKAAAAPSPPQPPQPPQQKSTPPFAVPDTLSGFTGADLVAVAQNGYMNAVRRQTKKFDDNEGQGNEEEYRVTVTVEDLVRAGVEVVGSVDDKELERFTKLRERYDNSGWREGE